MGKNKMLIGVIVLIIAIFGLLLSPTILLLYYPELADKIDDSIENLLSPPPSLKELEELEKVEPMRGKIAFESNRGDNMQIYIMNTDGSNITRLTDTGGMYPEWSPDGKKIAFTRGDAVGLDGVGIYIISVDGSKLIQPYNGAVDESFAWSPDSKKIAFASPCLNKTGIGVDDIYSLYDTIGIYDIYVINIDGSNLTRLTNKGGRYPTWSPDGKKIAFVSTRNRNDKQNIYTKQDIYIMNADGSNQTQVIIPMPFDGNNDPPNAQSLSWSPDGKKIVFYSWWINRQIFVIDIDGNNLTMLAFTLDAPQNAYPEWSLDGEKITFASTRDDKWDIYTMNPDGSNVTRLGDGLNHAQHPTWSPP